MGASESRGRLRVGQMVKVEEEKSSFQQLQRKHGGWHEAMIECSYATGVIAKFALNGDAFVLYETGNCWLLNPAVLIPIASPVLGGSWKEKIENLSSYNTVCRTSHSEQFHSICESFICPICIERQIDRVFYCGHSVCHVCLPICLANEHCPICRGQVSHKTVVTLYH